MKKPYTVILLYPDYISDGTQTYLAHTSGLNRSHAITNAQKECTSEYPEVSELDDFKVIAVFDWHLSEAIK